MTGSGSRDSKAMDGRDADSLYGAMLQRITVGIHLGQLKHTQTETDSDGRLLFLGILGRHTLPLLLLDTLLWPHPAKVILYVTRLDAAQMLHERKERRPCSLAVSNGDARDACRG